MEVSLRENGGRYEPQEWIIQLMEDSSDEFWKVGELIMIKNKVTSLYLCSHKKKIKENDQYEVFGQRGKLSKNDINNAQKDLK